jgi:hypothetical protein
MSLNVEPERRVARVPVPRCPQCFASDHHVAFERSEYLLYFRCNECGLIHSVQRPSDAPDEPQT